MATKFSVSLQKLIVQHARIEKQMQSVMGSDVINFTEGKMMLGARSKRTTNHIRGKKHQFQRNNILVICFSV